MKDESKRSRSRPKEPLSPSSQIGRMRQTGGTPESRRWVGPEPADDGEDWREPRKEDEPVERVRDDDPSDD